MTKDVESHERATIDPKELETCANDYLDQQMDDVGTVAFEDLLGDFIQTEYLKGDGEPSRMEAKIDFAFEDFDRYFSGSEPTSSEMLEESVMSYPTESAASSSSVVSSTHREPAALPPTILILNQSPQPSPEANTSVSAVNRPRRSGRSIMRTGPKQEKEDPNAHEWDTRRRENVLERNRAAAARCRQKKKAMETQMKDEVERLRMENEVLTRERDYWMTNCSNLLVSSTLAQEKFKSNMSSYNHRDQGRLGS